MARTERHPTSSILDAARSVVLERGPRGTTLAAIAACSGAPVGSIYHRFGSLEELLARLWLRAARRNHTAVEKALDVPDPSWSARRRCAITSRASSASSRRTIALARS